MVKSHNEIMSEEEKVLFKQMLPAMREGWEFMARERRQRIRDTVTMDDMPLFDLTFKQSLTQPSRQTSGLVEFYRVMARSKV